MKLKTFIIDWGESANGGRYALIQSTSIKDAWLNADIIGSPVKIVELKLKKCDVDGEQIRYMEFDDVKTDRVAGKSIADSISKLKYPYQISS
jgi:hypothetical protein